jgi:hypothetical protein
MFAESRPSRTPAADGAAAATGGGCRLTEFRTLRISACFSPPRGLTAPRPCQPSPILSHPAPPLESAAAEYKKFLETQGLPAWHSFDGDDGQESLPQYALARRGDPGLFPRRRRVARFRSGRRAKSENSREGEGLQSGERATRTASRGSSSLVGAFTRPIRRLARLWGDEWFHVYHQAFSPSRPEIPIGPAGAELEFFHRRASLERYPTTVWQVSNYGNASEL